MEKESLLTLKRQKELIAINKVLAVLVVCFAFLSAYLLAAQEQLLIKKNLTHQVIIPSVSSSPEVVTPVVPTKSSPLKTLLSSSRYSRTISAKTLTKEDLVQLLFAAQGQITEWGERTVPSYKSLFPLTILAWVRNVETVSPGLYLFDTSKQSIVPYQSQTTFTLPTTIPGLTEAPLVLIASTSATLRNEVLTWHEAGGVAQNILLAASESQLSTFLIPSSDSNDLHLWFMPISDNKDTKL